ncbi:MAG: choice-of-anchor J domain-containing protein [Bacteroidales bacterium]|nr:choice-of-anchor J domain-containing protein [Bacteroidales bacterium]
MKQKLLFLVVAILFSGVAVAQTASEIKQKEMAELKEHGPTVEVPQAEPGSTRAVGDDCTTPIVVSVPAALPYNDLNQTNCGRGNTYSATCLGSYDNGEDIIYRLDVTTDVVVDITMDPKITTYTGILIADDCPDVGACIDFGTAGYSGGPTTLYGVSLTAGNSYYIMVDTWPAPNCIPDFDLTIVDAVPLPPGSTCADPHVLTDGDLPFSQTAMTTCGFGDDYDNNDACASSYMRGDDFVFEYTPASDVTIDISLANTNTYVGLFVTDGCPDVGTCVGAATSSSGNPSVTGVSLTGGTTYYIIVSTWPSPQCTDFDIVISAQACPAPSDQAEANITLTSADLSWTENGGATSWNIEYGPSGFTQGSGTLVVAYSNPFTLGGLSSSTNFDWYISADCGGGARGAPPLFSPWTGPSTFTTVCTPNTTFPWTEDFEGSFLPACWTKIVPPENDITQSSSQDHTTGSGFSARFSSFSGYNAPDYNQYLFSPAMTIEEANRILSFWYKKFNNSDELLEWGISTTTNPNDFVWTPVSLTTDWQQMVVNLKPWVGQTVYIGFHYYGDYLFYVYLDDVQLSATPPVPVSNWAIVIGVLLISAFIVVRFRKRRLA